jgi:hypothetical protein
MTNGDWETCKQEDPDAVAFRASADLNVLDLLNVFNFLMWYQEDEPDAYWGGVKITSAISSLQALLYLPDEVFEDMKNIALHRFNKMRATKEH